IAEERPVLGVRDIRVDRQCIEVIRQVEAGYRELKAVFWTHLEESRHACIRGKETRKARGVAIRNAHIVLQHIEAGIRKSISILDDRVHLQAPKWNFHMTPCKKPVG